jgi:hypothetical protein
MSGPDVIPLWSFGAQRFQSEGRSKRAAHASSETRPGEGDAEGVALAAAEVSRELAGKVVGWDDCAGNPGAAAHATVIQPTTAHAKARRRLHVLVLFRSRSFWTN